MAIDTAEKRRSVSGISVGWGITPNVAKDSEWRQQVGWSYSGIAADTGDFDAAMFPHLEQQMAVRRRKKVVSY